MIASIEAERTVLGTILLNNSQFDLAAEQLEAQDFALDSHRRIFAAMGRMIRRGRHCDAITLAEEELGAELPSVGGLAYVSSLPEGQIRFGIESHIRIVRAKSQLRSAYQIGEALTAAAEDPSSTPEEIIGDIESRLMELRAGIVSQQSTLAATQTVSLLDRLHRERNRVGELLGLPSGIASLDVATRGFQPGEITQLGARSGVGKSAAMVQAAIANCRQGTPVLVFSLEMTTEQILRRIWSAVSNVPFPRVRDPKWANDAEMEAVKRAAMDVGEWPLHVVDISSIRIEKLIATARLAIRRDNVKLVAIDYAQIVQAEGRDERLRVAAVSRGLTRLAKDEGIPVLVLSQLARADRSNANRRPGMGDLRESSQLENDAHVVALIHRPWDEENGRLASEAELIIAKQRSGETGVFPLMLDRRTLTFESVRKPHISAERATA